LTWRAQGQPDFSQSQFGETARRLGQPFLVGFRDYLIGTMVAMMSGVAAMAVFAERMLALALIFRLTRFIGRLLARIKGQGKRWSMRVYSTPASR